MQEKRQQPTHMRHNWDDYCRLPDTPRVELVAGDFYAMSPAPETRHQYVVRKLAKHLERFFDGKSCQPWLSPVDVRLSAHDVVQPDLAVVCDPAQVTRTHIEGAPALVIEVLSASSVSHDSIRKLQLYAAAGVREYWLVNPYPHMVQVLVLENGHYSIHGSYSKDDVLESPAFPGLSIPLTDVFAFAIPAEERIDEVRETAPDYGTRRPGGSDTPVRGQVTS